MELDGEKPAYLCFVHSDQALVHFGPGRNRTDVPQLVGVFSERTGLHLRIEKPVRHFGASNPHYGI